MRLIPRIIRVESKGVDAISLAGYVEEFVESIRAGNGLIHLFTRDRGVSIVFVEYEPGLLGDLEELINKLGLRDKPWLLEPLLGKNITIPVVNSRVDTGVFKHPVLIDLTGKPGMREVLMIYEGD